MNTKTTALILSALIVGAMFASMMAVANPVIKKVPQVFTVSSGCNVTTTLIVTCPKPSIEPLWDYIPDRTHKENMKA